MAWGAGDGLFNSALLEALLFAAIGARGWSVFSVRPRSAGDSGQDPETSETAKLGQSRPVGRPSR